eukprot:COSAG01_NODE_229_length_21089_cov_575.019194_3_plen_92_part_00
MASPRGRRFRRRQGITAQDLVEAFDPQAEVVRVTEIYLRNIRVRAGADDGMAGMWNRREISASSCGDQSQVIPSNHKSSEVWDRFVNCLAV